MTLKLIPSVSLRRTLIWLKALLFCFNSEQIKDKVVRKKHFLNVFIKKIERDNQSLKNKTDRPKKSEKRELEKV